MEAIHDTGKSINDGSGSIYSNVCINGACLSATNFILAAELCMNNNSNSNSAIPTQYNTRRHFSLVNALCARARELVQIEPKPKR